jgi:hypothetical protein
MLSSSSSSGCAYAPLFSSWLVVYVLKSTQVKEEEEEEEEEKK